MDKNKMNQEEKQAICEKLEMIFAFADSDLLSKTFDMLNQKGIANGCFQDYFVLSELLSLQSKIIAIKKSMEARNNG